MSYNIRKVSSININHIKIGKTFKYNTNNNTINDSNLANIYYIPDNTSNTSNTSNTHYNVNYQDIVNEKTKLIIQTPLMYIPSSIIHFNDKPFLELSFNNEDNDKDVYEFKKWISELEDYIFKLIKKKHIQGYIKKDNMSSIIKNSNTRCKIQTVDVAKTENAVYDISTPATPATPSRLLIPINKNISKCILNDDVNKNKFLFNWEIPVPTYATSIIWIKNVWIKNGIWGINMFMYATRVMNSHILDPIDFIDITDNFGNSKNKTSKTLTTYDVVNLFHKDKKTSITLGEMQEFKMFFKMLQIGIPKDAVKHKMILLKLDARIINYPESTPYVTAIHYISNPQLGEYIKTKHTNYSNIDRHLGEIPDVARPDVARDNIHIDLLHNIKNINFGDFKLKKVCKSNTLNNSNDSNDSNITNITNNRKNINTNINTNTYKVPSLADIQSSLYKLKSIIIPNVENKK